ncbi:hypothetical protein F5Y02DRAFT_226146 [Annulohypoxylon stygium]|nr:hypothetical protein F5Y02DRAFT_226146 [Annulohypoxylon stygium]
MTWKRRSLSFLHVFTMVKCLYGAGILPSPFSRIWAQFVVWASIHTSSTLLVENLIIHPRSTRTTFTLNLRAVFRTWSNIRRLALRSDANFNAVHNITYEGTGRFSFALKKCVRALSLWLIQRNIIDYVFHNFFLALNVSLQDFAAPKQDILPSMIQRDLYIRVIFAVYWIWDAYVFPYYPTRLVCCFIYVYPTLGYAGGMATFVWSPK